MAAAGSLKNRKIAISQQRLDRSPQNLARWGICYLPAVKSSTFQKPKMAHGHRRRLNN